MQQLILFDLATHKQLSTIVVLTWAPATPEQNHGARRKMKRENVVVHDRGF